MTKVKGVQAFDCPKCGQPAPGPEGHLRCADATVGEEDVGERGKMLVKIRKLLALAEGSKYEEEATSAWEKAQELMTRYAIDDALLKQQDARGGEEIVTRIIPFRKKQGRRARKLELLRIVASANRVRSIDSSWELPPDLRERNIELGIEIGRASEEGRLEYVRELIADQRKLADEKGVAYLVGLESDVGFVELLYMSVQLQAWRFMLQARREDEVKRSRMAAHESAFLAGFNTRVAQRLAERNKQTQVAAQRSEDARTGTELARRDVALALRDTRKLVDEEVNRQFGKLGRGRGPGAPRDAQGYASGQAYGQRADLTGGRGSLGSPRKELPS